MPKNLSYLRIIQVKNFYTDIFSLQFTREGYYTHQNYPNKKSYMKKIVLVFCFLFLFESSYGGIAALTVHSRANCANNESISWHLGYSYWLFTTSDHINASTGALVHSIGTGWQYTWRSAAVHWGEGRGGWVVHGYHWIKNPQGQIRPIGEEIVTDCSIYDGWWDH